MSLAPFPSPQLFAWECAAVTARNHGDGAGVSVDPDDMDRLVAMARDFARLRAERDAAVAVVEALRDAPGSLDIAVALERYDAATAGRVGT